MFPHLDAEQLEAIKIMFAYAVGFISASLIVFHLILPDDKIHPERYEKSPQMLKHEQLDDIEIALKNNLYHLP